MKHFIGLSIFLLLIWSGCDNYKDETYTISAIDDAACQVFETDTLFNSVATILLPDSLGISAIADSLQALNSVFSVNSDSLWKFTKTEDTTWSALNIGGNGDIILYTNRNVNISVFASDGMEALPTRTSIDLETIAYCDNIFSRFEYSLTTGVYAVRFSMETARGFKMIVLNQE